MAEIILASESSPKAPLDGVQEEPILVAEEVRVRPPGVGVPAGDMVGVVVPDDDGESARPLAVEKSTWTSLANSMMLSFSCSTCAPSGRATTY